MNDIGGPLSAKRWNARYDRLLKDAKEQAERLHNMFLEDGHAPFTQPKPPEEQWAALYMMYVNNEPGLMESEDTIKEFQKLSDQLGLPFPPPMPAPPMAATPGPVIPEAPPPPLDMAPFPVPPLGGPAFGAP